MRWHDPFFGRIGPETLLGLASSNGLMDTLSGYVIKKAISQMAGLMKDHILFLSLNLAPADLISGTSASILFSELIRHHLPPGSIMLELTEEQCSRPDTLAKQAARLAQRGFQLALDDFGKGCSNFDRLLSLPVSTVKIDRDLTQTLFSQGPRQKQILGICRCLYQQPNRVIFEGIETEAQSAFIAEHFPDAWRRDGTLQKRCRLRVCAAS